MTPDWKSTVQPAWVHTALNAVSDRFGWRMTMSGEPVAGSL